MKRTKHIHAVVILLSLTDIRAVYAQVFDATCSSIQTINTSQFIPPSPDPAGIAYLRAPGSGNLMISDSEVEETMQGITFYQGVNMFEVTPGGSQVDTWDTTNLSNPPTPPNPAPCNYSNEPTGVAYNPNTDRLFITDDNKRDVYEIRRGTDGFFGTNPNTGACDDGVTTVDTAGFGSTDPEGVGYGDRTVWISDGANNEVYKIALGSNEVLDGNDAVTHFDTQALGIIDPEGIDYDPVSGHLFLATTTQDETLYEVDPAGAGTLVRTIGVQPVPKPKKLAGVGVGPTDGQGNLEVYLADRGVDNDSNPNENDGKVYKCIVPPRAAPGNQAPTVSAGPDQTINLPTNIVNLNGTVTDVDGPPPLTFLWEQVSGPGAPNGVTFGDDSAVNTTASFPLGQGTYGLQLTATDGLGASASDEVTITVNPAPPVSTIFLSLAASSGTVGGVSFRDEDILKFENGTWSMYFDGSDVGVTGEIDALVISGTILFSLAAPATLAGVGAVDDSDIVEFTPTSTGVNTAGTFTLFFRGLGAGLDTDAEDIDAIGFTPNGALVVSTTDSPSVTCGPPACPSLKDEDLLVYTGAALGEQTTNSWNIYFDGSDVALGSSSEDVNGTDIDGMNGDIYLTTKGVFSVSGVSGDGVDIFVCDPGSTGGTTSCAFRPFFDGSANGLTGDVDGFDVQ